jgi:hypothetical protein
MIRLDSGLVIGTAAEIMASRASVGKGLGGIETVIIMPPVPQIWWEDHRLTQAANEEKFYAS